MPQDGGKFIEYRYLYLLFVLLADYFKIFLVERSRKSIRLADHDYSSAGYYFITICCRNRDRFFGNISDGKMILSETGTKTLEFWLEIPLHFKFVKLDEFVFMPDHMHGILILHDAGPGTRHGLSPYSTDNYDDAVSCHGMTLAGKKINRFSKPVKNSVSVIINQYKASLKRWCNKNRLSSFCWQSRFYDRILSDEDSVERTRKDIRQNIHNWKNDKA